MNNSKIISRILAGDKDAYCEIVEAYTPLVRTYLWGRLSDRVVIDDLSQEIFLAVYWNLESFDRSRDFEPWLWAVIKKKLMGHLRTVYSQKNSVNNLKIEINDELLGMNDPEFAPEKESIHRLKKCLETQPVEVAELIRARYFRKEAVQAIAERLESTADAISCLLYRARRKLKFCIMHGENW